MGIEANIDSPLAEAVRKAGSQSAFARLAGKSQPRVNAILKEGKPLWAESVLAVEAATGVSKHRLRPDIYPDETTPAPTIADALDHGAPRFGTMDPVR